MPNPLVGQGAPVSEDLQRYKWALYLSPASGAGVIPTNKLGSASEPASPWVRQGRLRGDDIAWRNTPPEFLEGRAGFEQKLKFKVQRRAGTLGLALRLDEDDPDVQAKLLGDAAGTLSNGSNTGASFTWNGDSYPAKVLLVGIPVEGEKERHLFFGNAAVTFQPVHEDEYEGLDVIVEAAEDSNQETLTVHEWN